MHDSHQNQGDECEPHEDNLVGKFLSHLNSVDDTHCATKFAFARTRASLMALERLQLEPLTGAKSAILQSGYNPRNFVRGEVYFLDFMRVLRLVAPFLGRADAAFVDLGCGVGTCLAAAFFSARNSDGTGGNLFSLVYGLELSHVKAMECELTMADLVATEAFSQCQCEVVETDFLKWEWWLKATVAYACATCFDEEVSATLCGKLSLMPAGSIAILVDQELSLESWELVANSQVGTTWGVASVNVYRKDKAEEDTR